MNPALALACGAVAALAWAVVASARAGRLTKLAARRIAARRQLNAFAERALELSSTAQILSAAGATARALFGAERLVAIEPAEEGGWVASVPGVGPLPPPPERALSLLTWFKHNPLIAARSDLGDPRFGAMRGPLREVMDAYGVDAVMPVVDRERVLAVIGLPIGRRPGALDRELLRLFRLETSATYANIELHHQAAHMVSLSREVDLASSVELTMVPAELEGGVDRLSWAGHYAAAGRAASDFFGVYPLTGGRAMVVIGDAVGHDLAGTMVSAVVKSCCDAIFERRPEEIDPAQLLRLLNGSLYRPSRPALTSCFAALFDPTRSLVFYANAGHVAPYRLRQGPEDVELGSLTGAGPLLGDALTPALQVRTAPLASGDAFFFLTDGVLGVRGAGGKSLGERRLARALRSVPDTEPTQVRQHVNATIRTWRTRPQPADDEAFLVVRLG